MRKPAARRAAHETGDKVSADKVSADKVSAIEHEQKSKRSLCVEERFCSA